MKAMNNTKLSKVFIIGSYTRVQCLLHYMQYLIYIPFLYSFKIIGLYYFYDFNYFILYIYILIKYFLII